MPHKSEYQQGYSDNHNADIDAIHHDVNWWLSSEIILNNISYNHVWIELKFSLKIWIQLRFSLKSQKYQGLPQFWI
jgi:hypothetical protein